MAQSKYTKIEDAVSKYKKVEDTQEQVVATDKYKSVVPVTEESAWDNPMMPSEVGLDVGTPEQKKALARNVAQGFSLGTSDEIEARARAWTEGRPYQEVLEEIRSGMAQYKQAAPEAAMLQELSGAATSPVGLLRAPKAVAEAGTLARSAYQVGLPSAVYGAAASEGDIEERIKEGARAGAFGTFGGVFIDKTMRGVVGLANRAKVAPTVDVLEALKNKAYDNVDQDQIFFNPNDIQNILKRASDVAQDFNYVTLKGAPTAVERARKMIESVDDKTLTLGQVERLKKNLYKLGMNTKDETGEIVKSIAHDFERYMDDVFKASGDTSMQLARAANKNYSKAKMLDDEFKKVEGNFAGSPLPNKLPVYARTAERILNDPKKSYFLSDKEKQLLDQFAKGSFGDKTLSLLGKLAPDSGLSSVLHITAAVSNPWIGLLTFGTAGARYTSNKQVVNRSKQLIEKLGGIEKVKQLADAPVDPSMAWAVQEIENILYSEE